MSLGTEAMRGGQGRWWRGGGGSVSEISADRGEGGGKPLRLAVPTLGSSPDSTTNTVCALGRVAHPSCDPLLGSCFQLGR